MKLLFFYYFEKRIDMKKVYGYLFMTLVFGNVQADTVQGVAQDGLNQSEVYNEGPFMFEPRTEEYGFAEDPFAEYDESGMCSAPPAPEKLTFVEAYLYPLFSKYPVLIDVAVYLNNMKVKIDGYVDQLKIFMSKWLSLKSLRSNK
jgi:hypothetical protein